MEGNLLSSSKLPKSIQHLAFSESRNQLIACVAGQVLGLSFEFETVWSISHGAPSSVCEASHDGSLWVATSTRRLRHYDDRQRVLSETPIGDRVRSLALLESGVVVTDTNGNLLAVDEFGATQGHDRVNTAILHACWIDKQRFAISTRSGTTVMSSQPRRSIEVAIQQARSRFLEFLDRCESTVDRTSELQRECDRSLKRIDTDLWRETLVCQKLFLQRKSQDPKKYQKIAQSMLFADAFKARLICNTTKPAILDGSNITRSIWNMYDKSSQPPSRLQYVMNVRKRLQIEINPILYPLVIVVDSNERKFINQKQRLLELIARGEILETPNDREADAAIFNMITEYGWADNCTIISNDKKMFEDHSEMLPGKSQAWYERIRRPFAVNHGTEEIRFLDETKR